MSERTVTRRKPERGSIDRSAAYAILDEALHCQVAFVDAGPTVIPMLHARVGDELFLHGSPASRLIRTLSTGADLCISVTILDGLVLARSAFNSSANYRSVVVFGRALAVPGLDARRTALDAFTDKLLPGRRAHLRPMTDKEVKATSVLRIPIDEFSVKSRSGPPGDHEDDPGFPGWAGVIPLAIRASTPEADAHSVRQAPDHVLRIVEALGSREG